MLTKTQRDIVVFALRYALPRHTYAPSIVYDYIKANIDSFEDWEIEEMLADIRMYYPSSAFSGIDQEAADQFREYLKRQLARRNNERN